jgi:thiol-disulfide isomerase/thioredoxin
LRARPSILCVTAFVATPAFAQEVGSKVPPVALEGFAQDAREGLRGLRRRAVLLDFFAYWCGPCARSVPHVNGLQELWGPKGCP